MFRKVVFYKLGNTDAKNNHFLSHLAAVGGALGSRPTNLQKIRVLMSERRSRFPLISNHVTEYEDFFSTLKHPWWEWEGGHQCNCGTLACDEKRTPTASKKKKICVLSAVRPECCETIIISIRRTALHWRRLHALTAEGVMGTAQNRGEELGLFWLSCHTE